MKDHYHSIVKYVLPLGVLNYFEITSEETKAPILYIAVSEGNDPTPTKKKLHSKGFYPSLSLTDFPVRDKELALLVRHREWEEVTTGKVVK